MAMIIFGIITLALSMALAESLRAQGALQAEQEHSARLRAVFDLMTRDIQAAYGTLNSPSSVFVGGGVSSGTSSNPQSSVAPGSLLTLSSLSHHLVADELTDPTANPNAQSQSAGNGPATGLEGPQWDGNVVRYDLDTQSGTLRRTVSPIPNLQLLTPQSDPGVQTIVTDHVVSLTLRYWDGTQQTWRDNWDYEQQNQAPTTPQTGAAAGAAPSGASGQASTANTQTSSTSTGDTYLPSAVELTLVLRGNDGTPLTYVTLIPVVAPQPETNATGTAAPTPPAGSTGTTGSTTGGATTGT